jgi:hypothetical protein
MSVEFAGVVVNTVGAPILPVGNTAGRKAFFRMFFDTPTGQKLAPLVTSKLEAALSRKIEARFSGDAELTLDQFVSFIDGLLLTRDPDIIPPAPAPVIEADDTRERNPDGRFKNAFQIYSETHSALECREEARRNPQYAEWRRGQMRVEGMQPGTYTLAGVQEKEPTSADLSELEGFAKAYHAAPSFNLHPRGGYITLSAQHRYRPEDFEKLVSRATKVGLI